MQKIADKTISLRASGFATMQLKSLQELYEENASRIVVRAIDLLYNKHFDPETAKTKVEKVN